MATCDLIAAPPAWRRAAMPLLLAAAGLAGLAALSVGALGSASYRPLSAAIAFAAIAGFVVAAVPPRPPAARFGAANGVTLLRGVLTAWTAGLVGGTATVDGIGWWVAGVTLLALVLDGVDGRLARQNGSASAFGARFDMEVDALFILVLSVLVFQTGRAGAWVLAIGAMRYAFGAAALVVPALRRPLPESFRRKLVCVVQGVALGLALAPALGDAAAATAVAGALAALTWSFAVDIARALRPAAP